MRIISSQLQVNSSVSVTTFVSKTFELEVQPNSFGKDERRLVNIDAPLAFNLSKGGVVTAFKVEGDNLQVRAFPYCTMDKHDNRIYISAFLEPGIYRYTFLWTEVTSVEPNLIQANTISNIESIIKESSKD